jgi:hypothetical protein
MQARSAEIRDVVHDSFPDSAALHPGYLQNGDPKSREK